MRRNDYYIPSDEAASGPRQGPTFQDGQRRVDYVLTYHVQKPQSVRRKTSRFADYRILRSLRRSLSMMRSRDTPPPKEDPEIAAYKHRLDYHEDDKRFCQNEFEDNLREMGLELEKDEGNKIPGIGFLKIHAPWNVLCREAEFMKLKMPTKKGSDVVERINLFIHKVTAPLHPKVEPNRPQNVKHLSHPFSREKQHLFDLSDRESFFDSKTRASIVYEVLKRTRCTKAKYTMGITSLLGNGVYTAAYPLHDGDVDGVGAEANDRKMLIPAAIVGVIVFLYGCATVDNDIPSMEICDPRNNITMCPLCDRACSYWKLKTACGTARASHLFDNPATVFFSIFMALWEEEGHHRAEYEIKVMQKTLKKQDMSPEDEKVKLTCTDLFGVILYRISIRAALHMSSNLTARSNVRATVKGTAAVINLVMIIIMDEVYGALARRLTLLEVPKTDKSFEERLIFKTFVLKFANAFTPIVYLAFFRGRMVGRPGDYVYVIGSYRMEERSEMDSQQQEDYNMTLQRHEKDHFLGPFVGLSPEYMEMIIQFGMVTLFVASFPLAPLFALLNNIIEIRLDAKKFVTEVRRPIAARAKDIGIWYNLLRGLSKVAVIVNAFVISFTSDFIPRLVYQYMYSPDGSMHGFVNHTLSYFNNYRETPWSNTPYDLSKEFWAVLACRLAFVIGFQNVVMLMSDFVDWLIPDIPKDISLQIHKEKLLMVELFMKEEEGKKLLRDNHTNQSPLQPRSRPASHTPSNC
ncbi:unnamed protein product [Coregonus sp. 'balchen']|nr:unnamed protein product [Coregonus sp. 'balchen']